MTPCSFDTETHLSYPGNQTPKIVCASWATFDPDGKFTPGRLVLRDEGLDFLELLLDDPEVEICGAHIAYDFGCASAARPHLLKKIFAAYDANRVWDILLGEALFDIRMGCIFKDPITGAPFERYSQGMLEERLLGIDRSEAKHGVNAWRLRYCELDGIPLDQWPPAAVEYPKDDAVNCLAITKVQKARGDANTHCMGEQASAAFALHLAACWGIRTDPKIVAEVVAEVTAGHHAAVARFAACGLYRADGTKDSALLAKMVARAYGAKDPCPACGATGKVPSTKTKKPINCSDCDGTGLNIDPCPQTPKGGVKCDRDVLKESGDETLTDFAATGENEKWFSTYIPIITQGTEAPINAEVNALVATGRVSYRKPNLTNQPRNGKIRECYTARDGRWLFTVDFGGIELVTLAQTCIWYTGGSAMADALNAGQDLHDRFAASVRNISYEMQHSARTAGDKNSKNFRQLAKSCNFGYPGGLGADKFVSYARQSYGAKLCELAGVAPVCGVVKEKDKQGKPICAKCRVVAADLRKEWFRTWPEVRKYHDCIKDLVEDRPHGGSVTVLGKENVGLGLTRGGVYFCDGANTGFQGLAARGAKRAFYRVTKECYTDRASPLFGSRPLIMIHDEILGETPDGDRAHFAAYRVSEIMINTMREYTPDVRVTAPPALMPRWFKGAEPVHQCPEHGKSKPEAPMCCDKARLIPWEPKPAVAK